MFTHVKQGALARLSLGTLLVPRSKCLQHPKPCRPKLLSFVGQTVVSTAASSEATKGLETPKSLSKLLYPPREVRSEAVQAFTVPIAPTRAWNPSPGSHSLLAYNVNRFIEGGEGCLEPQYRTGQPETTAREHTELHCCWVTQSYGTAGASMAAGVKDLAPARTS